MYLSVLCNCMMWDLGTVQDTPLLARHRPVTTSGGIKSVSIQKCINIKFAKEYHIGE